MNVIYTHRTLSTGRAARRRNVAVAHVLQFFDFSHLPDPLQKVAAPIARLAVEMADDLPENPELTAGLRKLLEAKDCFVRARLLS